MKKLVYSPRYRSRMIQLKQYLEEEFGPSTSRKVLRKITDRLHLLQQEAYSGVSLKELFGIDTEYRYVFVNHNYVFYRVEDDHIFIINIYNEREDFLFGLFGIRSVPEEEEEE